MSTLALAAPAAQKIRLRGFDLWMTGACAAILGVSIAGCLTTSIHTSVAPRIFAVLALTAMMLPAPAYWHEKRRFALRDAALTIPWAAMLAATLAFPLLIAARLRMPLQDAAFARIDGWLGVNVASIAAWSHHHAAGAIINWTYPLLTPLLAIAIFVPALSGRVRSAREFLLANLFAFAAAVPLFALLPAIGPWHHFGFLATPGQADCQAQLLAVRLPGRYIFSAQDAGIVCFPSFHVIWALLCARALWTFRLVRIPVAILSAMIVLSTMTTGWHYFSDVLAGIAIAATAAWLASRLTDKWIAQGVITSF